MTAFRWFEMLLIFCAVYEIVAWMINRWGPM